MLGPFDGCRDVENAKNHACPWAAWFLPCLLRTQDARKN
ncbi:hypothetical protein Z949_791 [Sulfitobacter guttiformis KCTC 32187]|nr:hypothetical protein Z949_791 [Sulfitobacter guttiformis KCTC 32187]